MDKRLVILVYNPRRFTYVVKRLRKRGISYYIPDKVEYVSREDIVYTDSKDVYMLLSKKGVKVLYDPSGNDMVLEKAILLSKGKDEYFEVSIGIDPGERHTVAVIADGELVDYALDLDEDDVLRLINKVVDTYPTKHVVVKIGKGVNGLDLALYLARNMEQNITMEIIDEHGSSPSSEWRNPFIDRIIGKSKTGIAQAKKKDIYAAIMIALKSGIVVENIVEDYAAKE